MLSESFVASTLSSEGSGKASVVKDVGIYIQGFQPRTAVESTFKKSSTPPNCLAVSATHIFAAQAQKAVVHVYSRERNNQEATVPFPERIQSATFAGDEGGTGILVLGTQGGRIIIWEVGPSPIFLCCLLFWYIVLRGMLEVGMHGPSNLDASIASAGGDGRCSRTRLQISVVGVRGCQCSCLVARVAAVFLGSFPDGAVDVEPGLACPHSD